MKIKLIAMSVMCFVFVSPFFFLLTESFARQNVDDFPYTEKTNKLLLSSSVFPAEKNDLRLSLAILVAVKKEVSVVLENGYTRMHETWNGNQGNCVSYCPRGEIGNKAINIVPLYLGVRIEIPTPNVTGSRFLPFLKLGAGILQAWDQTWATSSGNIHFKWGTSGYIELGSENSVKKNINRTLCQSNWIRFLANNWR